MACDSGQDGTGAEAVVLLGANGKGQQREDGTRGENTNELVFKDAVEKVLGADKGQADHDAEQSAEDAENRTAAGVGSGEVRDDTKGVGRILDTQQAGNIEGGQGSNDTGNQSGIVHDAYTNDLHGEDGRREGRAEDAGESSAHAGHDHDLLVVLVEAEQLGKGGTHAGAHLQSCALTADGGTEQVRDSRRHEDEGRRPCGDILVGVHRRQRHVRALFRGSQLPGLLGLAVKELVDEHNEKTAEGQEPDDAGVLHTDTGHVVQNIVEARGHQPHHRAKEQGKAQPAEEDEAAFADFPALSSRCFPKGVHGISPS